LTAIATTNPDLEIGLGNRTGYEAFNILGRNPALTTTYAPVWYGGSTPRVNPTANDTIELRSTSANDTAAGTGAQAVVLIYLDENYAQITSPPIFLNGTTFVTGPIDFFRLNRILVIAVGSTGRNEGTIEAYANSQADLQGAVQVYADGVGMGQSADSYYTVPADSVLVARDAFSPLEYNFAGFARSAIKLDTGPELRGIEIPVYQSTATVVLIASFPLPAKADIWLEARLDTGGPIPAMLASAVNKVDAALAGTASAMSMCAPP
jgi:hypothetical protein